MAKLLKRILDRAAAESVRNREIRAAWEVELLPLQEIADRHGLTRERVRQILKGMDAISATERKKLKRESDKAYLASLEADFLRAAREIVKNSAKRGEVVDALKHRFPQLTLTQIDEILRTNGLVVRSERATKTYFSDEQLRLGVYMCFGLQYELALSNQDFSTHVSDAIRKSLEDFALEKNYPQVIPVDLALNAIGFFFSKLEEGGLDPFPHKSYEDIRKRIWEANNWETSQEKSRWPPTQQTVSKRLGAGYWSNATDSLGFPSSSKSGRARGGSMSKPELVWAALAGFVAHAQRAGLVPSVGNFEEWRKSKINDGELIPSSATARKVVGSWSAAINSIQFGQDSRRTSEFDVMETVTAWPSICVHQLNPPDCDICRRPPEGTPNRLFVQTGDRHYHSDQDCSSLQQVGKRDLESEAGSVKPVEVLWAEVPENFAACRTCIPING